MARFVVLLIPGSNQALLPECVELLRLLSEFSQGYSDSTAEEEGSPAFAYSGPGTDQLLQIASDLSAREKLRLVSVSEDDVDWDLVDWATIGLDA